MNYCALAGRRIVILSNFNFTSFQLPSVLQKSKTRKFSSSSSTPSSKFNLVTTPLESRSLVRLTGPDTLTFLQGLITNDIHHLETTLPGIIFTLLLNHQGRVLYDILLYSSGGDEVILECDKIIQQQLIKHLTLYRVKKKVVIQDISGELSPWVVFNKENLDSDTVHESTTTEKQKELTIGNYKGNSDPRLYELGWRFILPTLTQEFDLPKTEFKDYRKLLITLGIGEGVKDIPPGTSFPLESNGDYVHGISFHKGCYVGQELTARTHHTGVVRKRLMPFSLPPGITLQDEIEKTEIKTETGKSVGKVRSIIQNHGLALTRIEEALNAKELKINDWIVKVKKPFWWPIELPKDIRR